ncbi:MAG: PA1571 family protein [Thiohalomonadales bacterium]
MTNENKHKIDPNWKSLAHFEPEFHGASIVAEDGSEIPITEQMLQQAFTTLISQWESGRGGGPRRQQETPPQAKIHPNASPVT